MADTLAYLYQLADIGYQDLSSLKFKVAVVDDDDANLSGSQISSLESSGKTMFAYLSIGEAEDYRDYWTSSWNNNPPSFLLGENPDWPGNYNVKFWDTAWQKIIIDRAVELAREGYSGICMDVVDCYAVDSVLNAYNGPTSARDEMMTFVGRISDATKAINPDFKIIQNNALDLLVSNPDDPGSAPNTGYLAKIDGVNAETTFYMENNALASWSAWNNAYLDHAVNNGKAVFAIDYPTAESTQQQFIDKAIAEGFIPFVSNENLDTLDSTNYQVMDKLPPNAFAWLEEDASTPPPPPPPPLPEPDPAPAPEPVNEIVGTGSGDTINGEAIIDEIFGRNGNDTIHGNGGNDYIQGDSGTDKVYGDDGNDELFGNDGSDFVSGGNGDDYMEGNAGADRLEGGAGNDVLWGNESGDTLIGGAGNDDLYGNSGHDKFYFGQGAGQDVINDFDNPGNTAGDVIQISSSIYGTKAQILSHIGTEDGNAVVYLDGDSYIMLYGVSANDLTASDFQIFA